MSKRNIFTTVTPLPPYMPRDLVIATLHDHSEMIELNPLVINHQQCKAPSTAPADEFHCTWYELTDKVQYLPGGVFSGNVSYKACFHDLPMGLQTHVYAPTGLDIKGKWTVCGNLPHEPREPVELGLANAPREGLYLREDVDMRCNIFMMSFVKKTLKKAHAVLVDRLLVKADLEKGERDRETASFHQSPYQSSYGSPSRHSSISGSGQFLSPSNHVRGLSPSPSLSSQDPRLSIYQDPRLLPGSPLASPYYQYQGHNGDRLSAGGSTSGGPSSIHEQYAEAPSDYGYGQPARLSVPPPRHMKMNDDYSRHDERQDHPPVAELA